VARMVLLGSHRSSRSDIITNSHALSWYKIGDTAPGYPTQPELQRNSKDIVTSYFPTLFLNYHPDIIQ
jgi:hypothetical protein